MRRRIVFSALAASLTVLGGASSSIVRADAACAAREAAGIRWINIAPNNERGAIDRSCSALGSPVRFSRRVHEPLTPPFAIVTWNTHNGGGDIDRFVADLSSGTLTGGRGVTHFVLLLQETYRARDQSPASDITQTARRLDLDGVYVPSMRHTANADRGNTILSTSLVDDVTAIELPFERQRRVTIEASVRVKTGDTTRTITVVSTHFTNTVAHHGWLLSEFGRHRQAKALARALPADGPLIVGGDFNAWFGFRDAAYRDMAEVASPAPTQDRRATFGPLPLRLDHLLFRLPQGWTAVVRRANDRYGSDHYPLVATIALN